MASEPPKAPPPRPEPPPAAPSEPRQSPLDAHEAVHHDPYEQRPELFIGAAFVGGFLVAQLLKWVGEDDDE